MTLHRAVRDIFVASTVIGALCLGAARAEAQGATEGAQTPNRAVFGGTGVRGSGGSSGDGLSLSLQLYEAYDDDVLADQAGSQTRPRTGQGADGFYTGLGLSAVYARPGRKADFRSWVNSTVHYYPDLNDLTAARYGAGATFTAPLGRNVQFHIGPYADYSPRYSMRLFQDLAPVDPEAGPLAPDAPVDTEPTPDYSVIDRASYRYGGSTGINITLTDASNLSFGYGYLQTTSDLQSNDAQVHSARVGYGHKLTRWARLKLGYSRQDGGYDRLRGQRIRSQNLNIGLDYQKPLSRSRRTYFRFNTGSVLAEHRAERRLQAVGAASLLHQIGRTWSSQLEYRRDVRYLDGFDRPVFSDSISASLGGLMSRKWDFSASAGFFNGSIGISKSAPQFDSYTGVVRVRRAITHTFAAYAEYLYYRYRFDEAAARPVGLPREFDRHGARVGINLWLPLFD